MQQTLRTPLPTLSPLVAPSCLCRAKNSGSGVPQAVTCQVTVTTAALPVKFIATALQGVSTNPKDTDLRTAQSDEFM